MDIEKKQTKKLQLEQKLSEQKNKIRSSQISEKHRQLKATTEKDTKSSPDISEMGCNTWQPKITPILKTKVKRTWQSLENLKEKKKRGGDRKSGEMTQEEKAVWSG